MEMDILVTVFSFFGLGILLGMVLERHYIINKISKILSHNRFFK